MGHLQYILPKMQWLLYKKDTHFKINKTKSIGVSEANYTCILFLNGGIIINSD